MPAHVLRVGQIVLGSLVVVGLLLTGLGALLPRHWHVTESIMINAPPTSIHAWVNDLHHWPLWAQWNQTALAPKNEVSNPGVGSGATLTWYGSAEGDGRSASGEIHILRSDPTGGVWFESRTRGGEPSQASVTYAPKPGVTEVTWRDQGQLPPIVGGLFLDLFQQRLSAHMAAGLVRLKDLVELGRVEAAPASSKD